MQCVFHRLGEEGSSREQKRADYERKRTLWEGGASSELEFQKAEADDISAAKELVAEALALDPENPEYLRVKAELDENFTAAN